MDARRERVALLEWSPFGVVQLDAAARLVYANEAARVLTGVSAQEPADRTWLRAVDPRDRRAVLGAMRDAVTRRRTPPELLCRVRHPGGAVVCVRARTAAGPGSAGVTVWMDDVTVEYAARVELERRALVLERSDDFVTLIDESGELVYANETVRRFFGVANGFDLHRVPPDLGFTAASRRTLRDAAWPALRSRGAWVGELTLRAADGSEVHVLQSSRLHIDRETGRGFVSGIGRDITELKQTQARLAHLASHDPLTGLANRTRAEARLHQIAQAERERDSAAVLFVDIDGFKRFNDRFGHAAGDAVLVELADRLRRAVRPTDFVARLGGDEFVIVCDRVASERAAHDVAERVLALLREPFTVSGSPVGVSVSIGIAGVGLDAAAALRAADAAMYRAKRNGRARAERHAEPAHA